MNTMRFGMLRAACFGAFVVAGLLLHVGQATAADGQPLATSVRAQTDRAQTAIKTELAVELRAEARAEVVRANADRMAKVAAAIEAASGVAPVAGLMPYAYGAVMTP